MGGFYGIYGKGRAVSGTHLQPFSVVTDRAEGVYVYDVNGKKYLDFASGIGVCSLGYGNEEYTTALKKQVDKIIHTSNLFYNTPVVQAAEKLVKASGLKKPFLQTAVRRPLKEQ